MITDVFNKYPSLYQYDIVNENFTKVKFDDFIFDISNRIISLRDIVQYNPVKQKEIDDAKPEYSEWSYDEKSQEIIQAEEGTPGVHPIYIKYYYDWKLNALKQNNQGNNAPVRLFNPSDGAVNLGSIIQIQAEPQKQPIGIKKLNAPAFFIEDEKYGTEMSMSIRDDEVDDRSSDPAVLYVYLDNLPKLKDYTLKAKIIHEMRHLYDMFRIKNIRKYNNSLNNRYVRYLNSDYIKDNHIRLKKEFKSSWIMAPGLILNMRSRTEIKAICASIDKFISDNKTLILLKFSLHNYNENIGIEFINSYGSELNVNLGTYKRLVNSIEDYISKDDFLFPIFMTSVLMNEGLIGNKDTNGFCDFKYFDDCSNKTLKMTNYISEKILKMYQFCLKTLDNYISVIARETEKSLKKYGLYDRLIESFDSVHALRNLKCKYSFDRNDMIADVSAKLNESVGKTYGPYTKEELIIRDLKNSIYEEYRPYPSSI